MTPTVIMEELSKSYLEVIASSSGYFNAISRDYGTDLTIRKAALCSSRKRYLTTGKAIDIQVKSVYEKYILNLVNEKEHIRYNMEVKNYCDLIDRVKERGQFIPLYLVVFILPNDLIDAVEHSPEQLVIKKRAYWYQVDATATYPTNKSKFAITIPKANIVTKNFFNELFSKLD